MLAFYKYILCIIENIIIIQEPAKAQLQETLYLLKLTGTGQHHLQQVSEYDLQKILLLTPYILCLIV